MLAMLRACSTGEEAVLSLQDISRCSFAAHSSILLVRVEKVVKSSFR
jgi:hypothetical protein